MAMPLLAQPKVVRHEAEVVAHAVYLGERIDTQALEGERLGSVTVAMGFGAGANAVVYRHGSVVMFGGSAEERDAFLARLAPLVVDSTHRQETEEVRLVLDPGGPDGVAEGAVVVQALDPNRLSVVADALSKSVVLARHERKMAEVFAEIEPLARALQRWGRIAAGGRALAKRIGASLLAEHQMVGRVEVNEKPDELWDHPELERLWETLVTEYELRERSRAVERKLELVARTTATVLDLLQSRRNLRVEWMIVLLIVVEVMISLYELGVLRV